MSEPRRIRRLVVQCLPGEAQKWESRKKFPPANAVAGDGLGGFMRMLRQKKAIF